MKPTMGIVKKSFFDIVASSVENSVFLDLFAGTGSVGIEALKRGAKKVIFVEKNHKYSEIIRKKTSFYDKERYEIYRMDVYRFLALPMIEVADIVYADPPYDFLNISRGRVFLQKLFKKVRGNCIIAIEHRKGVELKEVDERFCIFRNRQFGKTELTIYKRKEQ